MTREDREFAKSRIEYLLKVDDLLDKHDREALEMAIKALSQEPCESINKTYEFGKNKGVAVYWNKQTDTVELPEAVFRYILSLVPTVNPQPSEHFIDGVHAMGYREGYKDAQKQKSGKWLVDLQTATEDYYICSECGRRIHLLYPDTISNYPYCHCGAKMESEEKE